MAKEYQSFKDYRSDQECIMFFKQLELKFAMLKQAIIHKLTKDYTSTFRKLCLFKVHDVTRFLKHLSNEFSYEGFSFSELPMFYEVKKTMHN